MVDHCLKLLLFFGSFSAVARGEDEYTSTSTSTIASNYNECYAGAAHCDWENDPSADQAWRLYPSFDRAAWLYAYFSGSSPRGISSVRVVSPIFSRDDNYSCVSIHFKMSPDLKSGNDQKPSISLSRFDGLRVYQKPVHVALTDLIVCSDEAKKDYILFEVWGDQGDDWHTKEFPLKHFDSNFQIVLEGIFGEVPVYIGIAKIHLQWATECTTMSTTTTERAMRENGDTKTDKVTKSEKVMTSDTWADSLYSTPWVDSSPASPLSNLRPTTTWPTTKQPTTKQPTTKQPTTTQTLQEGNDDTKTDKVTKSDTWVDSPPASPLSNLRPTTTSPTTTQTPQEENGDTKTDKVTKSDTRVDSPPTSPQSNLWPTTIRSTTLPTTKQPTTTQTLQERNACDSSNLPIILYLIDIVVLLTFVCVLALALERRVSATYVLKNDIP